MLSSYVHADIFTCCRGGDFADIRPVLRLASGGLAPPGFADDARASHPGRAPDALFLGLLFLTHFSRLLLPLGRFFHGVLFRLRSAPAQAAVAGRP